MGQKESDGIDKKLRNPQAFTSWRAAESPEPQTEWVMKTTIQVYQKAQGQGYGLALIWLEMGASVTGNTF